MINFKNKFIDLRNFLNIRAIKILNNKITKYSSVSDAFFGEQTMVINLFLDFQIYYIISLVTKVKI